ncbi:hypothetical protein [Tateyamaria sp.]|uniref:hypothetical protein n=1 Tax=Tateyamaria sp. TaxID=1929288 RepID=UPI00329E52EF
MAGQKVVPEKSTHEGFLSNFMKSVTYGITHVKVGPALASQDNYFVRHPIITNL